MNSRLALLCIIALMASPAGAKEPTAERSTAYAPGELLVAPKRSVSDAVMRGELGARGARVIRSMRRLGVHRVRLDAGDDIMKARRELMATGRYRYLEPNWRRYPLAVDPASEPDFAHQWAHQNDGTNGDGVAGGDADWVPDADMDSTDAWDERTDASMIQLVILDDAVDVDHGDLDGNSSTGGCFEGGSTHCEGDDPRPEVPPPDNRPQTHGTLVAGSAGADGDDGIGITGAAPRVDLIPYKFDYTVAGELEALQAVLDRGDVEIVNMSFGGPSFSQAEFEAIQDLETAGILVVVAAGNSDSNNDLGQLNYPANYDLPNILSVAASDADDEIADFSQWGPTTAHLAAPGQSIFTTCSESADSDCPGADEHYPVDGTSFAAPLTAGVAALVAAEIDESGADVGYHEIKARLIAGAAGDASTAEPVPADIRGRVAAGRVNAVQSLPALTDGVFLIDEVAVDDSTDGDGALDPGEDAALAITIENVGLTGPSSGMDEAGVSGALSVEACLRVDPCPLTVDTPVQSFGDVAAGSTATADFPVSFLTDPGEHGYVRLRLDLALDGGSKTVSRWFYLELDSLGLDETVTDDFAPNADMDWDEFHLWHVVVPEGISSISITTNATDKEFGQDTDIDLLARIGAPPEYAIDPFFNTFVTGDDTRDSRSPSGNEEIILEGFAGETIFITVLDWDRPSLGVNYELRVSSVDTVEFTSDSAEVLESDGEVRLSVRRNGVGSGAASVDYRLFSGTADAGDDFDASSGTVEWADGDTADKEIVVPVTDDTESETTEDFELRLRSPSSNLDLGDPFKATVSINDDDGIFVIAADDTSVREDAGVFRVSVSREGGAGIAGSVRISSTDGTAEAGSDYSALDTTLEWAAGETDAKSVDVAVTEDGLAGEGDESFQLGLSDPVGGNLGETTELSFTLIDVDNRLRFTESSRSVDEDVGNVILSVERIGSLGAVSVAYASEDGSARAGSDYEAISGELSWADGETAAGEIVLPIIDDTADEDDETLTVVLSESGTPLAEPTSLAVTIRDDDTNSGGGSSGGGGSTGGTSGGGGAAGLALILGVGGAVLWRRFPGPRWAQRSLRPDIP